MHTLYKKSDHFILKRQRVRHECMYEKKSEANKKCIQRTYNKEN